MKRLLIIGLNVFVGFVLELAMIVVLSAVRFVSWLIVAPDFASQSSGPSAVWLIASSFGWIATGAFCRYSGDDHWLMNAAWTCVILVSLFIADLAYHDSITPWGLVQSVLPLPGILLGGLALNSVFARDSEKSNEKEKVPGASD